MTVTDDRSGTATRPAVRARQNSAVVRSAARARAVAAGPGSTRPAREQAPALASPPPVEPADQALIPVTEMPDEPALVESPAVPAIEVPVLELEPPSAAAFAAFAAAVAEGLVPDEYDDHEVIRYRPAPVVAEYGSIDEPHGTAVDEPAPWQRPEPPTWAGRVVTVYSPKGGTGTTFFATNLAVALADGGRRRVCLVDLDLQFGDVAISTSVAPNQGIVDAVDLDLTGEPDAFDRLVTPLGDGLDGLLAPVDPAAGDAVTPQLVADLLDAACARYEYVVVDTSTYLSEVTLAALDAATHQVLVTTPELPAIKNMRLLLDTLDLIGCDPARRAVVLNRLDPRAGLQAARAAEALRHPLAAVVPADLAVAASIDSGHPLLVARRADTIEAVLRTFAETHLGADAAAPDQTRRRRRLGRKNAS